MTAAAVPTTSIPPGPPPGVNVVPFVAVGLILIGMMGTLILMWLFLRRYR